MSELLLPEAPSQRGFSLTLGSRGQRLAVWLGAAGLVAGLAASNGGYFPTSWGWSALALSWVCTVALLVRPRLQIRGVELALALALAALAGWVWLSITWSRSGSQSMLEGERALVYLAGVGALLLVGRRSPVRPLLGGLVTGISAVCAYGLATRLFPERLGTYDPVAVYRLSEPLGYWNALGIFAALGALLALGFSVQARTWLARVLATASLVLLTPTLYFTFSRGSWVALAMGIAAAIALEPRRLRLATGVLFAAPAPALAVWLASRSEALTRQRSTLAAASHDGHRLALWLLALAALAVLLSLSRDLLDRRLSLGPLVRRAYGGVLALLVLVGVVAVFAHYGGPVRMAERAYDAFNAPPPHAAFDLNRRLFSFSGNGRADLWRAAWADDEEHPWLGSGAGSYEQYWLQHRKLDLKVRDAHSLYIETLAELGPVGLGLLLLALGVPLVAAVSARRRTLVPAAFGAYVAYLVHAGVDWDWEVPAVTLSALFCGAAMVIAARPEGEEGRPLSPRLRASALAPILALAAVAFVGLVGNSALGASQAAARAGNWEKAQSQARKAIRWAPWSAEGWRQLGEAQLARGEPAKARASFRSAIGKDERNWSLWLDLARASGGRVQLAALGHASELNPLSPEVAQLRKELAEQRTIQVGG